MPHDPPPAGPQPGGSGVIRTLVVDDEQPARERLQKLLQACRGVEVIGEAEDGEGAIERILESRPDLVFLDIQMPGCSGLEVAASLPSPRPKIVFCTAFDEYAVEAFELHAVDYLLKPVNRARLEKTVERLRGTEAGEMEAAVDGALRGGVTHPNRFLARRGSRYCVIPVSEVQFFASEGGQTKLQTADGHYWMQPTLADLEQRLDPMRFFRVSRGALVQLDAIREVRPLGGGHGEALLQDGTELEISRRRFKELMDRLGG